MRFPVAICRMINYIHRYPPDCSTRFFSVSPAPSVDMEAMAQRLRRRAHVEDGESQAPGHLRTIHRFFSLPALCVVQATVEAAVDAVDTVTAVQRPEVCTSAAATTLDSALHQPALPSRSKHPVVRCGIPDKEAPGTRKLKTVEITEASPHRSTFLPAIHDADPGGPPLPVPRSRCLIIRAYAFTYGQYSQNLAVCRWVVRQRQRPSPYHTSFGHPEAHRQCTHSQTSEQAIHCMALQIE